MRFLAANQVWHRIGCGHGAKIQDYSGTEALVTLRQTLFIGSEEQGPFAAVSVP